MLYDAFGNEIRPDKRPDDRVLSVATIRDRFSGYPSKGLTPERLANIFKEADYGDVYRQMELFEEMEEKDTHLFSILQTRKLAVTGLDFEIEPYSQEKKDLEIAEFVSRVVFDLPDFEDNLLDLLDGIGKGYSATEIYWDARDGKNIVRHLEWIHPKKFTWANSITPKLVTDEFQMGMDLPPFKFVFHRHKAKSGYTTRQGLLRICAWMYLFKNYDIKDWVAFAEVYGMPLRLGKYDPNASKEDKEALIQAVRSLGSDAAGIISRSTEIEFIEAVKNSGESVYEALAAFCDAQMSKAVLGHSASADSTAGKLGNEQQALEVRQDLKAADCEMVSKTLRRDLIRALVGFNFGWDAPLPWFKFDYEEAEDLDKESERYKKHIESGLPIGEDHMYEKFNIPKPKNGEKVVTRVSQPQPNPDELKAAAHKGCAVCMANKAGDQSGNYPDQEALDVAIDSLSPEELQKQMEGVLKPIVDMIAEGLNYEAILDVLAGAYPDMDDKAIEDMLARAIFMTEVWGRLNSDK